MKGVILAGGTGSRLLPLTKVTNKHLLPVGARPMILHSLQKLVECGIKDIIVITGTEHMGDMITLLGSGKDYDCNITYKVQDRPDGIAGALSLCESFCRDDNCVVMLADNVFQGSLHESIQSFLKVKKENENTPCCLLTLTPVDDPKRFGIASLKLGKIIKIVEKPKNPESDLCVSGIYLYDTNLFKFLKSLKKSGRGEYEITDLNNLYINNGITSFKILDGWWSDAGTHESYRNANLLMNQDR
tara:strand:- start:2991 stop:3722 length:732 start_codon:yes stop_codon:yes gene_type:complete